MSRNCLDTMSSKCSFYEEDFEESDEFCTQSQGDHIKKEPAHQSFEKIGQSDKSECDADSLVVENICSNPSKEPSSESSATPIGEEDASTLSASPTPSKRNQKQLIGQYHRSSSSRRERLKLIRSATIDSQQDTCLKQQPPDMIGSNKVCCNKYGNVSRVRCSSAKRQSDNVSQSFDDPSSEELDVTIDRMSVQELAAALKQLSRNSRFRSIRPPWRDPNSQALPSDDAVCVEEMMREYNLLTSIVPRKDDRWNLASPKLAVRRPYHSTLNRWRQQERIQVENFCMANRLRNIQPSRETSREELLKRYKGYFITPLTARSSTSLTTFDHRDWDSETLRSRNLSFCSNSSIASRSEVTNNARRLQSATSTTKSRSAQALPNTKASRPRTSDYISRKMTLKSPSEKGDLSKACNCSSNRSSSTTRANDLIDSLNSVRRALYEERIKGQL